MNSFEFNCIILLLDLSFWETTAEMYVPSLCYVYAMNIFGYRLWTLIFCIEVISFCLIIHRINLTKTEIISSDMLHKSYPHNTMMLQHKFTPLFIVSTYNETTLAKAELLLYVNIAIWFFIAMPFSRNFSYNHRTPNVRWFYRVQETMEI